ncbi:glycosyltransferase [Myroides marinus]|uniref:glycosyltransferase n=1 Tax=Myroides marinus TaxID=703342 RepID=UPI002575F901|nr:glycosyltransferase [Myroides marinus]MDM1373362.1 glycosyltransferase [Myroides marinus]
MSNIRVSVCLATYNGEKFIKEQLESILVQLGDNDEVIISDDHSSDSTLDIIKKFNDSRVNIFYNNNSRGYTRNFENALKHCKGQYIFLADQDDKWIEGKVDSMLEKLRFNDLVVSDALVVNVRLEESKGSHFKLNNVRVGFLNNWIRTRYIGACMAFSRKLLEKAMPFPSNDKLCAHDYWIANVGEMFFNVEIIEIPFLLYRRHDDNASTGGEHSKNSFLQKIKVRFYVLLNLFKRWKS